MHLAQPEEEPDVLIDGKGYVLENPKQFLNLSKRTQLRGVVLTETGNEKQKEWEKYKAWRPWERPNWREEKAHGWKA